MTKKILIVIISILLVFSGCSSLQPASDSAMHQEYASSDGGSERGESETFGLKVIKSGSMTIEVNSIDQSINEIRVFLDEMHGEVTYLHQYTGDRAHYANLTIRIPSESFDNLQSSLVSIGNVLNRTTSTTDVTEEYIDLEARRKVLEDKKEAYTDLLAKAITVEEILQVERELERVVYEIESNIGRMNFIENQVAMSTINLSIREKAITEFQGVNFLDRIRYALRDGFNSMLNFAVNFIIVIIWLIPFAPFIVLLYFLLKKLRSLFKKRKNLRNEKNKN